VRRAREGVAATYAPVVTDDDAMELAAARQQVREHFAMVLSTGRDPLGGVTWGPNVERFDHLLHALSASSAVPVADLPWTSAERAEVDNASRLAAVLDGPPLPSPSDGAVPN
jgi:hypothetical protein